MRGIVFVSLLGACSPSVNKCADKTLFLSVTLDDASKNANQLLVDVELDGAHLATPLPHTPGAAMGGIQIEFPNGYPAGKSATIVVTATLSGATVGDGSATVPLSSGCAAASLAVTGDLATLDLLGVDLTLSGADFSKPDLSDPPPDLSGVDLTGCIAVAEDCFNGQDDDCDALPDCADSDCTGGGSPVAACVSDPGVAVGTYQASGSCPAAYPTPTSLGHSFTPVSCGVGTCACSPIPNGDACTAFLGDYDSDSSCNSGGANMAFAFSNVNGGCAAVNFSGYADGDYNKLDGPTWTFDGNMPCAAPTGTATKSGGSFSDSDLFCGGGSAGTGCGVGKICVPAAPSYCILKPGNQVACPTNYVKNSTRFYFSISDNAMCSCACVRDADGSCAGSTLTIYTSNNDCTGVVGLGRPTGCTSSAFTFDSILVGTPTTRGHCAVGASNLTGSAAPADEQTLCCAQ